MTVATVSVVASACGHGGEGSGRVDRRESTTVVEATGKVVGRDEPGAEATTPQRFAVGTDASVLVPIGALATGQELRVRRLGDGTIGAGAIEGGATRFEITADGVVRKPVVLQVAVARTAEQSVPVALVRRTDGGWDTVSSDYADGSLTVYAPRVGVYTWVQWNWRTAASVAADTVTAMLRRGSATPTCTVKRDGPLHWCLGGDATSELNVANAGDAPLSLRVDGVSGLAVPSGVAMVDDAVVATRRLSGDQGALTVLVPGAGARVALTPGTTARAALVQDDFSRTVLAITTAMSASAGLVAGSVEAGVAALSRADVRRALVTDLTSSGCEASLRAAVAASDRDAFVAQVDRIVLGCVSDASRALVVTAAAAALPLRPLMGAAALTMPDATGRAMASGLAGAVAGLVAPSAGGDATVASAPDTSLPGDTVATAGSTIALVPVTPGSSTVTVAGGPNVVSPTTTVAAGTPARPTTTTRPATTAAPTTTTRPATTTPAPAPVTTPAPTAAPTTLAPPPPAPTTTTAPPVVTTLPAVPPLAEPTLSSERCSRDRGTIRLTAVGLTPSGPATLVLTPPRRASTETSVRADENGVVDAVIDCDGVTRGGWRVVVRDDTTTAVSPAVAYTVR